MTAAGTSVNPLGPTRKPPKGEKEAIFAGPQQQWASFFDYDDQISALFGKGQIEQGNALILGSSIASGDRRGRHHDPGGGIPIPQIGMLCSAPLPGPTRGAT